MALGPAIARWTEDQPKAGETSSLANEQPLTAKIIAAAALAGDPRARPGPRWKAGIGRASGRLSAYLQSCSHHFRGIALLAAGSYS